ncbi:LysR substrate-binding domain-containing protein [Saccharothrix deserti]|uniref:LysR substrate-binding domain-containing protein n=1 Tax=Saccharothrix deserti TaxID=2593674 RepID=UPI00131D88D3|nr:LysR substrate-binding domain-containing protein [Saccharothrix deserti]
MTRHDTGRIRFGYHGSRPVAHRIIKTAGHEVDDFELVEYDINEPFRALREGLLDTMIVKFGIHEPDLLSSAALTAESRVAVVGTTHRLADRDSLSVEELADHTMFECPGSFPAYVWDQVVPPHTPSGRPIRRGHRVGNIPAMMALVASGEAVHLSVDSLADVAPPSVRVIPVHDLPPAPVALAWRRDLDREHVLRFIADAERSHA